MPSLYLFFRWLKIVSFLNFRLSTNLCTSRTKSAISKRQSAAAASSSKTSFVCQTPSKTRPSFVSKNTFISVAPIFVPSQHPYCLILRQNAFFMFLSYHVFVILQASFANFTQNTRADLTETAKYNLTAPFHTNSIHKQRRLTA